jgi:hypothetical protein
MVPRFASIIRSGNVLIIQRTRISKRISPKELMETQMIRSKTKKYLYKMINTKDSNKQSPWSESASELYRPSDRRFSAK